MKAREEDRQKFAYPLFVLQVFLIKMRRSKPPVGSTNYLHQFDIFLPLRDRHDKEVPYTKLQKVRRQIVRRFGGITHTTIIGNPIYTGYWKSDTTKKTVRDENTIYTTLTPRTEEAYTFFLRHKKRWAKDLRYEKLLIVVHEVQEIPNQ